MSALLRVRGVSVRFGGVQALDGAGFELDDGELLGIIGPNGAGKTTLLRVITGVIQPNSGEVHFGKQDITRLSIVARVRLGLALGQQIVRPLRSLDVTDNVTLAVGHGQLRSPWKAMFRHDREPQRRRAREILERVGLGGVAAALPGTLPLGHLKRLELARALALDPRLLLLDEPLAGLNAAEAAQMADLIASLPQPGLSIVLIEHNLGEVMRICRTLYVQDMGRPLALGPAAEVMARKDVRAAYLGTDSRGAS